ncbi:glycosyltransferase family 4 protein [Acidobacteriota bacterium]
MKAAFVVQRYGEEVDGGAEFHCRLIAERLAKYIDVEVLTTCAVDYTTWKNHYDKGFGFVNKIPVRRFPVDKERDPVRFGRKQFQVFSGAHSAKDELEWMKLQGPYAPSLVKYIHQNKGTYDWFVFFSYRYYTSYHGIREVPDKAILVPTAEKDESIKLSIFKEMFNLPRGIMYNSFEEQNLIRSFTDNQSVPGVVVGTGIHQPESASPDRFCKTHGIKGPFILYVGRIDRNKGCLELFENHFRFVQSSGIAVPLVLIGSKNLEVPSHPEIHNLGFLPEQDKHDALASATLLVMPSTYESLSMVTLEAWAAGLPVLVNGHCEVLKGQVLRSNGGLYYTGYDEFHEALKLLLENSRLRYLLARKGKEYFQKNYSWNVIEDKYLNMLGTTREEMHQGEEKPE